MEFEREGEKNGIQQRAGKCRENGMMNEIVGFIKEAVVHIASSTGFFGLGNAWHLELKSTLCKATFYDQMHFIRDIFLSIKFPCSDNFWNFSRNIAVNLFSNFDMLR